MLGILWYSSRNQKKRKRKRGNGCVLIASYLKGIHWLDKCTLTGKTFVSIYTNGINYTCLYLKR